LARHDICTATADILQHERQSQNHSMSLSPTAPLLALPSELILHILSFLDVPELLSTSRVPSSFFPSSSVHTGSDCCCFPFFQATRQLRHLCLDPILHTARLVRASWALSRSIPCRPPLSELVQHRIYVSKTSFAARRLGRNLIKVGSQPASARTPGKRGTKLSEIDADGTMLD
jgi:hypothetical protein